MKSVMMHSFSDTPEIQAPRSKFDRSFGHKTTMDAGWLVPFFWDPVIPGDTFNVESTIFARLSTPSFPIMDNMYMDTHFFFVPYRLLWTNWKRMMGEQDNPADSIDYSVPILEGANTSNCAGNLTTAAGRNSVLMNYMGVPQGIAPDDVDISALPFRAYEFIYDQWFRDQNLIDSADIQTDDGPDDQDAAGEYYLLQRRGKRHDYFTSCLPNPQKGGTTTSVPLGSIAPIVGRLEDSYVYNETDSTDRILVVEATTGNVKTKTAPSGTDDLRWSTTQPGLGVDLTNATAASINDLREAFQTQKLLERDARAGTRYSELIKNHFGVDFYDVSYRPEYLGGGSSPVNINPVVQTGHGNDTSAATYGSIGDTGGIATITATGHGFSKSFVEHGLIMGIMSVRADLTYQQGLNRHFSHSTRYDFYWPSLAHLGEQSVLNKEIWCQGAAADDNVFGYQERYAEYRYKPSMITGIFQSDYISNIDEWHLAQDFASLPTLGQTFIEENPPLDRCIRVSTEPHFIVDSYTRMICARPMPVFGVPGMIDHF